MTDKVQKIRKEVERLKSNLIHGACASQIAMETRCKEEAYDEVISLLDSLQEEPVSEDLGEYINELSKQFPEVSFAKLSRIAVRVAKWQKQKDEKVINENALLYNARLEGIEIGKAEMKQQMMVKAIDVEVKVDAGGYPYIPQMELYDYDRDIPLAKEGDRYKVILIKED